MKFIVSILVGVFLVVANSLNAQKQSVTVSVVNVTSDKGKVGFALHSKATFMKLPLMSKRAVITDGVSRVTFENVEPGEYAVICYHDKNENGRMDFQENGMPLEDYGASNNVMSYGPPKYENSKFMVADEKVDLKIRF